MSSAWRPWVCAPWGSLGPHSPPVKGHWQVVSVSGSATVSGHKPGVLASRAGGSPGLSGLARSYLQGGGLPPATESPGSLGWGWGGGLGQIPPSISASRMSGMLMTSVGEPEYLFNGIPGGLIQGHWAHVSRYTHTWVKPRPAGTRRHAQAETRAPPLGEPGLGTSGLRLLGARVGSISTSREVGLGTGVWVGEHVGSSGGSGGSFS